MCMHVHVCVCVCLLHMSLCLCLCCNLQFACKCIINAMLNDLMILCNEFKCNLFAYLKTSIGFSFHSLQFTGL